MQNLNCEKTKQPILNSAEKTSMKTNPNMNIQTPTTTPNSSDSKTDDIKTKPIEMNTFVQLEIDNNNHACIPRVCRFCITKLNIQNDYQSIVLAVKLDASKRSLRTVDIPLLKQSDESESYSADLKLHYTVTYPHFLKKDSNYLYFYIQKRKKLKNRTILGFKTLAMGFVDLSSILQKPFSSELPLYFTSSQTNSNSNSTSVVLPNNVNKSEKIIGSLKIQSLTSLPVESLDLDGTFTHGYKSLTLDNCKLEADELDEDEELNKLILKHETFGIETNKDESRQVAESDTETDNKKGNNSKNFTGKILSFIKRFRNENSTNLEEEINNDTNLDDFDLDTIDQISDYSESDAEPDAYSIVSELKPKLQPFFTNNP